MGSVGKSFDFMEWRRQLHDKYNITIPIDVDNPMEDEPLVDLTASQRKQLEAVLDKIYKEFPELKQLPISLIYDDNMKDDPIAGYDLFNALYISRKVFDESAYAEGLVQKWYAGVLTSFHPQGTRAIDSLSHEIGHGLVRFIARREAGAKYTDFDKTSGNWQVVYSNQVKDVAQRITDNASKSLGTTYNNLVGHISHYATTNRDETIAEAVMDYMANKSSANPYSIAIVKALKQEL